MPSSRRSFTFFSVLTAYYIVRPVRDEMGLMLGSNKLKDVFVIVFVVMLLAVPAFRLDGDKPSHGAVVIPLIYGFFILNLVGYWMFLRSGAQSSFIANSFFVWAAVFNLFVISLFWSVMSNTWHPDQAKRLYGFISAGGTIGALTGPAIAQGLATTIGRSNMLMVAALFLGLAMAIALYLQTRINPPSEPAKARTRHTQLHLCRCCSRLGKPLSVPRRSMGVSRQRAVDILLLRAGQHRRRRH